MILTSRENSNHPDKSNRIGNSDVFEELDSF